MASYFANKKKAKKIQRESEKNDIDLFLRHVLTLNARDVREIVDDPKSNEFGQELRFIAIKLIDFRGVKAFIQYLIDNEKSYSRTVLTDYIHDNDMVEVSEEEEDEEDEDPRMTKAREKAQSKRRARKEHGSDSEGDDDDRIDSDTEEEDEDEEDEPQPKKASPKKVQSPHSQSERAKLENERRLQNIVDNELQARLTQLHADRRNMPWMSDAAFNQLVARTVEEFELQKNKIARTKVLPNTHREDFLTRTAVKANEEELLELQRVRERFLERVASSKTTYNKFELKEYSRKQKLWINIFRDAEWMEQNGRRVKQIYISLPKYGNKKIKYNGDFWYLAGTHFFNFLASSNSLQQNGKILRISTLLNGGNSIRVKILYRYENDVFIEQDENIFNLMQQYIMAKKSSIHTQKDAKSNKVFTLDNVQARNIGRLKFNFPGGDVQENVIAKMNVGKFISNYFESIANISAYLGGHTETSVFKQRLLLGWFPIDLTKLTIYDKIDYLELNTYYSNLVKYETDLMKCEYFFVCGGGKILSNVVEPKKPKIANENTNGLMINFPPQEGSPVFNIINIDLNAKPEVFIRKLKIMSAFTPSPIGSPVKKVYKKSLWDLVENALDFARLHSGSIDKWKCN